MFQKAKDVVMTIGSSMIQKSKALVNAFLNKAREAKDAVTSFSRRVLSQVSRYVAVGVLGLALSTNASADVPAGVTTAITTAATDVATVGAAVILVFVGIKVWKWIKAAL